MSIAFLQQPVQFLKGVGPHRARVLEEAGISTIGDLLHMVPRRYLDRSNVVQIRELRAGSDSVTVIGTVIAAGLVPGRRGRRRFEIVVEDEPGRRMKAVWFQGVAWISKVIEKGHRLALHGKPSRYGGTISFSHPDFDRVDEEGPTMETGRIIGLYPGSAALQKAGLTSRTFRKIIYTLLKEHGDELRDPLENLPGPLRAQHDLMEGRVARRAVHFPRSSEELQRARYRLKFEELFFFQLLLAATRTRRERYPGAVIPSGGPLESRFLGEVLPFTLTGAQDKALEDIASDMQSGRQMNRLLQGDVGSGKTVVAATAALKVMDAGLQAVVMAPTEILCEQHYRSLNKLLGPLGIEVALLTGSTPAFERKPLLAALEDGTCRMLVGTHAVIQDGVDFHKLGLAVVDEQHRFGVLQRATLFEKGDRPHMLLMTATPIPRSLAMTLYGDLHVSLMRERPPGRQPIKTRMVREKERDRVYGLMREEIDAGRQCYVVYPLVEESEKLDLKDAVSGHDAVSEAFPDVQVELVHGRMKPAEKEEAMARFVSGASKILVSTTVIEVGVDVPAATFMLIEHAERFGLSQLHQLRGRIGRGQHASTCILMAEYKQSEESRRRLRAMEETDDGFQISEIDMELRGAGDFFGTQQSGLPAFRIADLLQDQAILEEAREAAFALMARDADLADPSHQTMKTWFEAFVLRPGVRLSRIG
ncbi:MAG: ATP-dependent DNA helicase RecG [Bacteroidota bacterium]|nr:ATP-dependent DNA helicase RecG [Bacteroidota bacterium]